MCTLNASILCSY